MDCKSPRRCQPPLLFVQIETAEGVRNAREIAAISGVDVLFVGPADLGLSLSTEPDAPEFDDALDQVIDAARERGIHAGILVRNANDTPGLLERGFTKVAVDSDLSILRNRFLSIAANG